MGLLFKPRKETTSGGGHRRLRVSGILAIVVAAVAAALLMTGIGSAGTVFLGSFGSSGSGAGQFAAAPTGLAVNQTGTGAGASAGDVYAVEAGSNRVQQFSATGTFVRAFGWDVAAPGSAGGSGINEKQTVTLDASASGGSFTLSYGSVAPTTTAAISATATAGDVEAALGALGSIGGTSNVDVTGPAGGPWVVEFVGALADRNVAAITVASTALSASVGSQLTCSTTTSATTTTYRWLTNGALSTGAGANTATYTTAASDAGKVVQCQVFSLNANAGSTQVSNPPILVSPYPGTAPPAPPATIAATLPANPVVGSTETCAPGAWTGAPTFSYQWYKNGAAISGATSSTYQLVAGDTPAVIQCAVTGTAGGLSVTKVSQNRATSPAPSPAAPPNNTTSPAVTVPAIGASATTTVTGSDAFEVCPTAGTCQAGVASAGPGGMSAPQGVAVDQDTGNVYITDQGNARVDVFSADGAFQGAFGWGVKTGDTAGSTLDFCATSQCTRAGNTGAGAGQFGAAIGQPAVNPANGHVYIANTTNLRIDEFAPTVTGGIVTGISFVKALGWGVATGAAQLETCTTTCQAGVAGNGVGQFSPGNPTSIAVDASGSVFAVSRPNSNCSPTANTAGASKCRVEQFSSTGTSASEFAIPTLTQTSGAAATVAAQSVAIDPSTQSVLVAQASGTANQLVVKEFGSTGSLLSVSPSGATIPTVAIRNGLAASADGRVYVADSNSQVDVLGPPPAPTVTAAAATAVTTSSAVLHGTVTPPTPGPDGGYGTTYYFEYSTDGAAWSRSPSLDVSVGDGSGAGDPDACPTGNPTTCNVSQTVTGLSASTVYQVRVVATTGTAATSSPVTFTTLAAPPMVVQTYAADVDQTSATLSARINPQHLATSYHFEWGTTDAYGHQVPGFDRAIGSGTSTITAEDAIGGLQPNSSYHFRVVAKSTEGTVTGPDQMFTTLNAAGLPNNRGYELVSLPDKGASGYVGGIAAVDPQFQVAPNGQSALYPLAFGNAASTAGGDLREVATAGAGGWTSTQISPRMTDVNKVSAFSYSGRFAYESTDLSCRILVSGQRLAPDAPTNVIDAGGGNLFRQNADGTYTTITNLPPSNPALSVGGTGFLGYYVIGASNDCNHVVFQVFGPGGTTYSYPGVAASGVYQWDNGTLSNVAVRPDGSLPPVGGANGARPGYTPNTSGNGGSTQRAVSDDARRVFFTATSNAGSDSGKQALFVRKDGTSTVDVSASETAVVPNGAMFQIASRHGDKVFFLANYGLTSAPSNGPTTTNCTANPPQPCDLYAYDVDADDLTDLSATTASGNTNGATVGGALGVSDDGTYVYFASRGQLVDGQGSSYADNVANLTYNVYLAHAGTLSFVGLLDDLHAAKSGTDDHSALLTGATFEHDFSQWTSQVTPDGRHLLFNSAADVTGYDSGGVSEAYLFSADTGQTVCVSCRLDGQPSVGVVGSSATATNPIPSPRNVYNPNRALSITPDGSRVFFTMPDALAVGAVQGQDNIYLWENGQISLIATGKRSYQGTGLLFVGASTDGDSAFFTTSDALVPQDRDAQIDLYVAKVGGGFAPPPSPPTPCDALADACQGGGLVPDSPLFETILPPGPSGSPPDAAFSVKALTAQQRADLVALKKTSLSVTVSRPGTITVKGTAAIGSLTRPTVNVISASRAASRAGTFQVPITLSKAARTRIAKTGKLKVPLTVSFSAAAESSVRSLTFTKAKAKKKAKKAAKKSTRRATAPAALHGKVR